MTEWPVRTLGDIAEWYSGGTPRAGNQSYYGGGVRWAVIADLNDGIVTTTLSSITEAGLGAIGGRLAPVQAVMVSMYGTIGRVGRVGRPMATNQAIAWGVVDPTAVLPQFLMIWLQHSRADLDALGRGATQRNINREIIRSFPIPVPPLAEQRRIVDLIGAVDGVIATLDALAGRAGTVLHALREEAMGNGSVPRRRLADVLIDIDGGVSPVADDRPPREGEASVLKLTAVQAGRFDPMEAKTLRVGTEMPSRALVRQGDVLITRASGSLDRVGAACVVHHARPDTYMSDLMLRLHPSADLLPDYLGESLLADEFRAQVVAAARGSATMRKISRSTLREMQVPVPETIEEQKSAASILRAATLMRHRAEDAASAAKVVRTAVLSSLLSGETEIPATYDRFLDGAA